MEDAVVALVTAPDEDTAASLARAFVESRLAACVNLVPRIRSIYRWQEKVEDEAEVLMLVKTRRALVAALQARLLELHPYDTPELLVLPVEHGAPGYLAWIAEVTRAG